MKKVILSMVMAMLMVMQLSTNVFALKYGEEWGGLTAEQTSGITPIPSSTASTATSVENQGSAANTVEGAEGTYSDVPSTHWAYKAVERCTKTKWFKGYEDGTFKPNEEITRSEAAKVFVVFLGEEIKDITSTSFHDVDVTEWYAPYVEAGKDLFPSRTTSNGQAKFQPEMPISREDAMYALVRALNYDQKVKNADQSVLNMFSDKNSISEICRPYMAVAVSNGIVSGYSDGTIGAQDPLTRAQFATILYRATYIGALENDKKVLQSIDVEPKTMVELNIGESFEIKATAKYSDGSTEDYTSKLNPYTDGEEGIITINKQKVTGVGEGTVVVVFNNDEIKNEKIVVVVNDPNPDPTPEPVVEPEQAKGEIKGLVQKDAIVSNIDLYTVCVLDVSGSMSGEPLSAVKEAAKKFCDDALSAGNISEVAIVAYDDEAMVVSDFSKDINTLSNAIDGLSAGGTTDIVDGLETADALLKKIPDSADTLKSVVLMSDGAPCDGKTSANGDYGSYGNATVETAKAMQSNYNIYSLAFFHSFFSDLAGRIMQDSQNAGYYEVTDPSQLVNVFKDISQKIIRNDAKIEVVDEADTVVMSVITKDDCTFAVNVPEGDYKIIISSAGYDTVEQSVTVTADSTTDIGAIKLVTIK